MSYYDKKRGLLEIQGRLHEDATRQKYGGDIVNLNDVSGSDKFRTYDLTSSEGVYSVKSHISESGELNDWVKRAYMRDFDKINGWGVSIDSLELDAQALNRLKEGTPLPAEFKDKNREEQVNYLKNKSILCIPEDHVPVMRDYLREKAVESPETYQLPENYTDKQMDALTQRIQGTGLSSEETAEKIKEFEMKISESDKAEHLVDKNLNEEENIDYNNTYSM